MFFVEGTYCRQQHRLNYSREIQVPFQCLGRVKIADVFIINRIYKESISKKISIIVYLIDIFAEHDHIAGLASLLLLLRLNRLES